MAIVSITVSLDMAIPANVKSVDDFCTRFGYNSGKDGSKANFIKTKWIKFFKDNAADHSAATLAAATTTTEYLKVQTDTIIT